VGELRVQRLRAQAVRGLGALAEVDGEEVTAARLGRRTRCGRAAAVAKSTSGCGGEPFQSRPRPRPSPTAASASIVPRALPPPTNACRWSAATKPSWSPHG